MTDFTKADLDVVIPDIDRQRQAMHMSYQAMADACDVSQTTIIRVIKRQTSPTFDLLQKMAAAVRYEPTQQDVILPQGYTPDDYIEYLKRLVTRQRGDYERQLLQAEAQYNRLRNQDRRLIKILCIVLGVFAVVFVAFRAIDMRITSNAVNEAVDLCEACYSEIAEHSQFCAWCGHEQVSRFGNM
ncbi:MAG: helix-turn-helix transcriptional regulator [Clostridia bacterium]|nr:helix-turn-helix transcriptional regulator [Clostridia bacterium]